VGVGVSSLGAEAAGRLSLDRIASVVRLKCHGVPLVLLLLLLLVGMEGASVYLAVGGIVAAARVAACVFPSMASAGHPTACSSSVVPPASAAGRRGAMAV
jgi:hypothetical protein